MDQAVNTKKTPDVIGKETREQEDYIIRTRRHLHTHPELSTKEFETTAFIVNELKNIEGIDDIQTFEDITGCIATIRGARPGRTVMLRSDIDALPIQEADPSRPYCSVNPGVMHACGHDCHTSMLLGAARILVKHKDEICGTVKLLFQMAEEIGRQSENYVQRGCLKGVDAIFGQHVWVDVEQGKANFETGERMACSDRFTIQVYGEPSHGSTPYLGKDALLAASAVVMALQNIVSRVNDPHNALVITVGKMQGGTKENILCDHVELVGTCRAFNRELRNSLPELIKNVTQATVAAYGCTADNDYYFGPDPLINDDPELVEIAQEAAKAQISEDCLVPVQKMTGAEDFSVYLTECPGVYGFLSCRNDAKGIVHANHNPMFDVDESVLKNGTGIYVRFALEYLKRHA